MDMYGKRNNKEGDMKANEVVAHVLENGVSLVRHRKGDHIKGQPYHYDVKDGFTGKKKGWMYFDTFTASAVQQVYNALSPEHQEKFNRIPMMRLVDFTWNHVK